VSLQVKVTRSGRLVETIPFHHCGQCRLVLQPTTTTAILVCRADASADADADAGAGAGAGAAYLMLVSLSLLTTRYGRLSLRILSDPIHLPPARASQPASICHATKEQSTNDDDYVRLVLMLIVNCY
jgi:hypothetical protein